MKIIFASTFCFVGKSERAISYGKKRKRNMASEKRLTPVLKIKVPQVESLKILSDGMTSIGKIRFKQIMG
jgi:hypothetical protein